VQDQKGVEPRRQPQPQLCHPQIPGHVCVEHRLAQVEAGQAARNGPAGVIGCEQQRGAAGGANDPEHGRIRWLQQGLQLQGLAVNGEP
jgi:hypothetical protein